LECSALATLENQPYEVVITDLACPIWMATGGPDDQGRIPNTPVILMTAGALHGDERRNRSAGGRRDRQTPHIQELNDLILRMTSTPRPAFKPIQETQDGSTLNACASVHGSVPCRGPAKLSCRNRRNRNSKSPLYSQLHQPILFSSNTEMMSRNTSAGGSFDVSRQPNSPNKAAA